MVMQSHKSPDPDKIPSKQRTVTRKPASKVIATYKASDLSRNSTKPVRLTPRKKTKQPSQPTNEELEEADFSHITIPDESTAESALKRKADEPLDLTGNVDSETGT